MSIKQDLLERQIEAIGRTLAVILFGREKVKKVFEKLEEENQSIEGQKANEAILEVLINKYLNDGEFSTAEETLFSFMDDYKTLNIFITALNFYNRLLDLDDEQLRSGGFSREKINKGIEKLKQIYNV